MTNPLEPQSKPRQLEGSKRGGPSHKWVSISALELWLTWMWVTILIPIGVDRDSLVAFQ